MHSSVQITALLAVLLIYGCAAVVDPYPPVASAPQPDNAPQPDKRTQVTLASTPPPAEPVLLPIQALHVPEENTAVQTSVVEIPTAGSPLPVYIYEDEFWEQVRSNFQLMDNPHPLVRKQAADYAKHGYEVVKTLRRGEPYLAYILNEVQKYDLPGEVVLLPFIESAYDPYAYSHGRAAGLWQFIPSTGEYFGLKQDWWHDERRDIVASTDAALSYLEKLHREFKGDWLLTFAAYNAGGGTVRSAIRRNRRAGKPTDFWHLDLPAETRAYVPKLLGICRIIRDPDRYGVELPAIDSAPLFAVVETGNQLDIKVAAELAGIDTDELFEINPGFNRWATHPDGPHQLAIPVDKAEYFAANLAKLPAGERVSWILHKTAHGETLSHIARRYRTTVKALQRSNKLKSTNIHTGKQLLVPLAGKNAPGRKASSGQTQHALIPAGQIRHEVNAGDNLWTIAKRYQVPLAELKEWNQLDSGSHILPGQQLVIHPQGSNVASAKHLRTVNYKVRSGDSLYLISNKFKVSISDLARWNNLDRDTYLQPGQNIMIHIDLTRLTQK